MATINFYLKEPNGKEKTPIYLTFSVGQKRFKFYTQKKIHPKFWDGENQRPKKSFVGAPELKSYLVTMAGEVERTYTQFQTLNVPFTLAQLKEKLNVEYERKPKEKIFTLFNFIESFIQSVEQLRSKLTITAYKNTLGHLRDFQRKNPKRKVDFDTIDLDFYNDFIEYLIKEKNFANNTAGKQIKNLKVFLSQATERGINTKLDYESRRFKVLSENSENIYLNEEEILRMYELDLSTNKKLEKVRDLFIVGCYTGLRFSDFSQIKSENIQDGFISIRTQKTDEPVMIPIHWTVKEIMDKYRNDYDNCLPPANSNQKMNEYLKEIAQLAGLKEKILTTINKGGKRLSTSVRKFELITTHTARRSFATNIYLQGFPSISLMKITGHKTEKAFLTYIKISPEENANKLREFWNSRVRLKVV